jgi:tryptophan-rich sensory protein
MVLQQATKTTLVNVLIPVILAVAINGIVALGFQNQDSRDQAAEEKYLPPGPVIGVVWVVLLALLGLARARARWAPLASWAIIATIAYCLAYPLLVLIPTGDSRRRLSKFLNLGALVVAFSATAVVAYESADRGLGRKTPLLLVPLLAWTTYVNLVDVVACQTP